MLRIASAVVLVLLMVGSAGLLEQGDAWAQAKKAEPKAGAATKPGGDAADKPAMPSAPQLAILVQTAVVALSQANLTNNYTVLYALAAPDFQQNNTPEKLAQVFANVRKIDLTPVILYSPQLSRPPVIDDKGMLRLTGFYKTAPQQVLFDILYQPVEGRWRLYGISVGTQAAQPAQAAPVAAAPGAAPPAAAPAEPAAAEKKKAAPAKK
jgi:hypothetical protein